ncbi:protein NO VEIN domain-containing protein [Lysinibacillus sp. NPDC097214]|uniref:protein NO VEIN domain-containing protein n=1 Tax=Lysinibacillus sp. NPDC097214 TaxID=3390584 RepID=UPI003CFBE091
MDKREKLLITAFYLAKFDRVAYANLGYFKINQAHEEIGKKLGYKRNSVKNRRDDFDPLFGHRAGWHQVELSKSNLKIVDAFDHLSEEALRAVVLDLLDEASSRAVLLLSENVHKQTSTYTTRGITGKKAEAIFVDWFAKYYPHDVLVDTRDLGCGYDFEVENSDRVFEVKGLSGDNGGVLFTDKEWVIAAEKQEDYHLVLVKDCFSNEPIVEVYSNPHRKFNPKKQITTVINVNWGISSSDLNYTEID